MANYPLQINKVVSALPNTLTANMLYAVRVGTGYDLYFADATGSKAYKLNLDVSSLTGTVSITNGGTGASDAPNARTNLGLGWTDPVVFKSVFTGVTPSHGDGNTVNYMAVCQGGGNNRISGYGFYGTFYSADNSQADKDPRRCADITAGYYSGVGTWGSEILSFRVGLNNGDANDSKSLTTERMRLNAKSELTLLNLVDTQAIKAGALGYKKGWRKLSVALPSSAGEVTVAHGITTIETLQAKVTDSDGLIVFNNDPDTARQFYMRVKGANIVLGVLSNATKVFGKTVTIYAGEEL